MSKPDDTSVWKKEISFRRKAKPKAVSLPPVEPAPRPAAPEQAEAKPDKSMWKKELSFRKKKTPKVENVEPAEAEASAPAPVEDEAAPVAPPASPEVASAPAESRQPLWPPVPPATTAAAEPAAPAPTPDVTAPSEPPHAAEAATVAVPLAAGAVAGEEAAEQVHAEAGAPAAERQADPTPAPEPEPPAEAGTTDDSGPALEPAAEQKPSRRERRESKRGRGKGAKELNQLVGLKLGASQIAAAQVINKGGPRIVRMARMPLDRGVVVGGELREPEALAASLKTFFRKNKLPRNCVRLGISNNRIGVRTFEISGISDPKQLTNAVRFRAQETLPIPLDEAALDYRILEERVEEDGTRVFRVLLVVAHKELVERYVAACRKAGLKLVGIDLEAFALLRALSDPTQPPGEDAAVVCVSIGHDRSTLAVSDGRLCEFTRVLAWGGSALDAAIARVLDITPSAAVPIKHALSLGEEGEAAGLDARHAEEARRAMVVELQSFARELVASLRFYQEQPKSLGIVEIMITGGAAACGGLAAELERLIGIPVSVADPLMRVEVPRSLHVENEVSTTSMAVAVGLGIED
jgi:type IV pilus assembly protein PilM